MVDIENIEAEMQLLLLVVAAERKEPLDELVDGDLGAVVALRHVQVEALSEVRLVLADHILDVLCEVFFSEHSHAVDMRPCDLVLLVLAPQVLERVRDGIEMDLIIERLLVVGQLFVVRLVWESHRFDCKFIFLSNALLDRLHLDSCEVLDQVVNDFGSFALDQLIYGSLKVGELQVRLRLLLVVLPVVPLLHLHRRERALISVIHTGENVGLGHAAGPGLVGAPRNAVLVLARVA